MGRLVSLTDEDISLINTLIERCPDLYSDTKTLKRKLDKSQNRIKHASAKSKGRSWQYWVCARIAKLIGFRYDQKDDDCLIHSREMSQQGVDIILRGKARDLYPFDIECKAMNSLAIHDAVEQADTNAGEGRIGMVAFRQTNTAPLAIFSWESFEKLFKAYVLPVVLGE